MWNLFILSPRLPTFICFVYKWNPARQVIQEYFSKSNDVQVHEFSLEAILTELGEQQRQKRQVVVLLTASINYLFGQLQFRFFSCIQRNAPWMIDVYSTGHCMYGCQSCAHASSHRLPITFTNYMRTKHFLSDEIEKRADTVVCPSFSSEAAPYSLLSNKEIVKEIVAFPFSHLIKLHPLTYHTKNDENPLFHFSELEEENTSHFLTSKSLVPPIQTNTLKLIEHARVLICDFDSSIPFEALYFQDRKHLLVYEAAEQREKEDDRRAYFHIFSQCSAVDDVTSALFCR